MQLRGIEKTLVALLVNGGPIRGTAQVGFALWPDRQMEPQGAALAAGEILRRLWTNGFVIGLADSNLTRYEVTDAGRTALASDLKEAIDERQLTLLV